MNAVEIEQAVSELAEQPFDDASLPNLIIPLQARRFSVEVA